MNYKQTIEDISTNGCAFGKPKGNSMSPRIESGTKLLFLAQPSYEVGDVVLCKVKGTFMVHLILQINEKKGYLIGNMKKHENGWTHTIHAKAFREA